MIESLGSIEVDRWRGALMLGMYSTIAVGEMAAAAERQHGGEAFKKLLEMVVNTGADDILRGMMINR